MPPTRRTAMEVPKVPRGPIGAVAYSAAGGRRNSDASSHPSSAGGGRSSALLSDRSAQSALLRSVNAFLATNSAPVTLKPPLPSARDIMETLRFLLSRLDFTAANLEDDLLLAIESLGCPIKLMRSTIKAPGTHQSWPQVLSVIHWLAQLALYYDHIASAPLPHDDRYLYITTSYSHFITGDDDAVSALDEEYIAFVSHQAEKSAAAVEALECEFADLDAKLRALKSGLSPRDACEAERALLVEDVKKFEKMLDFYVTKVGELQAKLAEREREMEAKEREGRRICEENEELRRMIEKQTINARDAERMGWELQAAERDIEEAEVESNALKKKALNLDYDIGRKLKELEAITEQCNHTLRNLKLGIDFQFGLNAAGSSPAEVMGTTYKTVLKPALNALAEDTKKISVSKREELFKLEQKSRENATMLEEKKEHLAALEAKIKEGEARLSSLKKEMEGHIANCASEAEKIKDEFTRKERQLDVAEKAAESFLRVSEQKVQDAIRESEEETQKCARELMSLIDAVSEYKEYMESTISAMKTDLLGTVHFVGEGLKTSALAAKLVSSSSEISCGGGLKRARSPSPNREQPLGQCTENRP